MPKQQATPHLPLEFRTFESYLMLRISAAIREAFEDWPKMMRVQSTPTPVRKDQKRILPPPSQTRVLKKRKRNPVAWKRASRKRAPRRP